MKKLQWKLGKKKCIKELEGDKTDCQKAKSHVTATQETG